MRCYQKVPLPYATQTFLLAVQLFDQSMLHILQKFRKGYDNATTSLLILIALTSLRVYLARAITLIYLIFDDVT